MVIIDHETAQGMPELWDMTAAEINEHLGDTEVKIALHGDCLGDVAFTYYGDWRIIDCDGELVYVGVPNDEPLSTVAIVEKAYRIGRRCGYNVGYEVGKRASKNEIRKALGF